MASRTALLILLVACSCAAQGAMTNANVLDLVNSKLPDEVVVAKIKAAGCGFDTSPAALSALLKAGASTAVTAAVASRNCAKESPPPIPPTPADERHRAIARRDKLCPGCPIVAVIELDRYRRSPHVTKNQLKVLNDLERHHLFFSEDWEDSDYMVVYSQEQNTYSYTYVAPVTTTGSTVITGDVSATATTSSTTYQPRTAVSSTLTVKMSVFARGSEKPDFTTEHTGRWRWSKPDKDCLSDALQWIEDRR